MASINTKLVTHNVVEAVHRIDANDVTELYMGLAGIDDKGATSISHSLIKNTSLTHLYLAGNSIRANGATSISNSLLKNTSLTHLDLAGNSVRDNGATSISHSLIKNTSLTHLDLAGNSIRDNGATSISNSLTKNTSLKYLYYDYGPTGNLFQSIDTELGTNKDPSQVQKKKEFLLGWVPLKRLLNDNSLTS